MVTFGADLKQNLKLYECKVSLLTEHNCSRALVQRDVKCSSDDVPYAQKRHLGLIVGIVVPSQYDCTERNRFGLSNMILICHRCTNMRHEMVTAFTVKSVLIMFYTLRGQAQRK